MYIDDFSGFLSSLYTSYHNIVFYTDLFTFFYRLHAKQGWWPRCNIYTRTEDRSLINLFTPIRSPPSFAPGLVTLVNSTDSSSLLPCLHAMFADSTIFFRHSHPLRFVRFVLGRLRELDESVTKLKSAQHTRLLSQHSDTIQKNLFPFVFYSPPPPL